MFLAKTIFNENVDVWSDGSIVEVDQCETITLQYNVETRKSCKFAYMKHIKSEKKKELPTDTLRLYRARLLHHIHFYME